MAGRPNDAIFNSASQTKTANENAKQPGDFKCLEVPTKNVPPPNPPSPFGAMKNG